jgi:hypothetical protein
MYRTLNALSIDVAIGAMCSALFLGNIVQVRVSYTSVLILGLTVWTIYTADHLLDVTRLTKAGLPCSTFRHQFHQNYFNQLKLAWIGVFFLIVALLAFTPHQVIIAGIGLASIVAVYLLFNSYLSFGKEFIIAAGYTCGILLPTAISVEHLLDSAIILLCFFSTVLFNVFVFSYFDLDTDGMERKQSFVRMIGLSRVRFLFAAVLTLQIGLSIASIATPQAPAALLLMGMTCIMLGILYFKKSLGIDLSRIIGEAIFLLPGLYWALSN